ncbi:hypothetical protein K449DRAFT_433738 [Hypoxylon sp. EC38]|nr:hypothetical protein K449DRAFT_433738 [Hypoxylon sp. EC38]
MPYTDVPIPESWRNVVCSAFGELFPRGCEDVRVYWPEYRMHIWTAWAESWARTVAKVMPPVTSWEQECWNIQLAPCFIAPEEDEREEEEDEGLEDADYEQNMKEFLKHCCRVQAYTTTTTYSSTLSSGTMYKAISGFSTSVSDSSTEVIAAAPIRTCAEPAADEAAARYVCVPSVHPTRQATHLATRTPWTPWTPATPARSASPTPTTNISSTPVPSTTTTRACSVTDVCDCDECSPECCDNGACEITRSSPTPDS